MCGIAGVYAPNMTAQGAELFQKLLLINMLRGDDSTGVVRVSKDKQLDTCKGLGPSYTFVKSSVGKEFISHKTKPMLLLGHCRAATKGSVTKQNAHPFIFPHVAGVMNGTFHGLFDNSSLFETDSEAIYYNINQSIENKSSPIPGIQSSMVYDPAFALAFVDRKNGTLNFIKNDKRPLHFAFVFNRTALVWSSAAEHLEYVLEDVLKIKATGWNAADKDPVFSLHEHDMLTIQLGKPATTAVLSSNKIEPKKYSGVTYVTSPTNPQSKYYEMYGLDDDFVDESLYPDYSGRNDHNTGKSSRTLIKCEDGQYRTKEAEKRRLDSMFRPPNTGTAKPNPATTGVVIEYGKGSHKDKGGKSQYDGRDLSTLDWLKDAVKIPPTVPVRSTTDIEAEKRFKTIAMADANSKFAKPQSLKEMKHRLNQGCFCCGKSIELAGPGADKVHWWSREVFACGPCFDTVGWVREAISGDLEVFVHQGVSIH